MANRHNVGTIKHRLERISVPEPNSGCFLWLGPVSEKGYGLLSVGGKTRRAHRLSFEVTYGSIPAGSQVMHKCDQPSCIRPDHLVTGTALENAADCATKERFASQKRQACPNGHLYSGPNLSVAKRADGKRYRRCKACGRDARRRYLAQKAASQMEVACDAR